MSDENVGAKRIAMENLKPGMIVAKDVFDKNGLVMLEKDTALDDSNFNKVLLSGNAFVFILENSIIPYRKSFLRKDGTVEESAMVPIDIPVWERQSFIEFEAEYEAKPEQLKDELLNIAESGKIDQDRLFAMTQNVMSKLKTKNDVFTYLNHLKSRDEPTYSHSVNVSLLANLFAAWTNAGESEVYELTTAGILHDIGKTQISPDILNKRGRLTSAEYEEIKKHTVIGYRILENADVSKEVKMTALGHHEKIDGSGYPLGIKGEKISRFAKIIAICDIYDAMTSNRIYRDKICPFDVIKSFERGSYGVLDTEFLLLFLQNIAYTYLNSKVELSDGRTGEVVFINRSNLSNPLVRTREGEIVDLKKDNDMHIVSIIS